MRNHLRYVVALACLVVPFAVAATPSNAEVARIAGFTPAQRADAVVDTIGVNIHLHYTDTVYGQYDSIIKPRLLELGVRHVRDGAETYAGIGRDTFYYQRCRDLAANGIDFDLITAPTTDYAKLDDVYSWCDGAVESFEGVNEPDLSGNPNWVANTRSAQQQLWNTVKGNSAISHVTVTGPSVTSREAATALGNLSSFLDRGNVHQYYSGRHPETGGWGDNGYGSLAYNQQYVVSPVSGGKPFAVTEAGYHNAMQYSQGHVPVPENVDGRYLPRLFLEHFWAGPPRTYKYELIDEGTDPTNAEHMFGLLRNDGSRKPAFNATKHLISLLSDPGPAFTPSGLDLSFGGDTTNLSWLLLQKRDGRFFLPMWLAAESYDPGTRTEYPGPTRPLTVFVGPGIASATAHLIDENGNLTSTTLPVMNNSVTFNVRDEVTVLELD